MPSLYLISLPIEEEAIDHIPPITAATIQNLDTFIVERTRTARRFIRKIIPSYDLDAVLFLELDKRNYESNINQAAKLMENSRDIGLMSESGSPCIADPGSRIVDAARQRGYKIVPLSGPSSIILSLMASGLNGQQFCFHGYLPIKEKDLKPKMAAMEKDIIKNSTTHIFIETPYRNQAIYNHLISHISERIKLCVAINLTSIQENIRTLTIAEWKKTNVQLEKCPSIFLIGS